MSAEIQRRLVFGDDGSPGADVAWLWVNNHSWPGWKLDVVTATSPLLVTTATPLVTALALPEPREILRAGTFASVQHSFPEQDPLLALSTRADLIVIGARGRGPLKAVHLGSTADRLATRPPSPLMVVRHARRIASVVVAYDDSADARRLVEALCTLPFIDQILVTVAAVDEPVNDIASIVETAAERIRQAGANVNRRILSGRAAGELLQLVQEIQPDVLAFGSRGRSRLARIGSTASTLLHHAQCSVLVAHRPISDAVSANDRRTT